MRRLRNAIAGSGIARVSYFFDPRSDVLVCSNVVRNPWKKPYVLRLDGIAFDADLTEDEISRRNLPIFSQIDGAAGLVFQAKFSRDLVAAFHRLPNRPAVIIPNGVDLKHFTPHGRNHREALGIPRTDLVFLTSAKWRAHKRLGATIDAFTKYCAASGERAHLLVLGDLGGETVRQCPGVRYIGHVKPEELPSWYRTADICIFLSWLDNCPNTVVEALACGVPVLCTNQGGTRELIELTNGGTVVAADEAFTFRRIPLYRPPEPDSERVVAGLLEIVRNRTSLSAGIDREKIGMASVARRYADFMQTLCL